MNCHGASKTGKVCAGKSEIRLVAISCCLRPVGDIYYLSHAPNAKPIVILPVPGF